MNSPPLVRLMFRHKSHATRLDKFTITAHISIYAFLEQNFGSANPAWRAVMPEDIKRLVDSVIQRELRARSTRSRVLDARYLCAALILRANGSLLARVGAG